jgi:uncharacterized beta-barrel protein YwiB (DUF1934 family)
MKKDVLMILKSVQSVDSERSETELITPAVLTPLKNGGYSIVYEETEATGFDGSKTTLSCYGNKHASICRSGTSNSNLIIDKDKKHHCMYGTPYGDLMVGIYTHDIINQLSDDGGNLYMKYTIDINSSYVSDNEIFVCVKPTPSANTANTAGNRTDGNTVS